MVAAVMHISSPPHSQVWLIRVSDEVSSDLCEEPTPGRAGSPVILVLPSKAVMVSSHKCADSAVM